MSGIPSWARAGAKVVCIKRGEWENIFFDPEEPTSDPSYGEVVTIAETGYVRGVPIIWLAEYDHGFGYDPARFRPLVSQSDDLEAHFTKLLDVPLNHEREAA